MIKVLLIETRTLPYPPRKDLRRRRPPLRRPRRPEHLSLHRARPSCHPYQRMVREAMMEGAMTLSRVVLELGVEALLLVENYLHLETESDDVWRDVGYATRTFYQSTV